MAVAKLHSLDEIFYPKSIAVVGASTTEQETGWVARLLKFGYKGQLYPINPKATEINGLKAYPSVRDVPGPVDYVIFNIPARLAPQILEDCVAKGVKAVHLFTAGFSETGKEDARKMEARVAAIAKAGGVRVIGPNCMGMYHPAAGVTFNAAFSKEPGSVAFVSQTGAGAGRFVRLGNERGIRFSKVLSYGNAIDLDAPELLEYLADDDVTKIIACYVEGIKDGPRYLKAVNKCLQSKPVIIMKAGLTEGGAGAAASHTASLAGSKSVWDAFFKQSGVIQADSVEEMADIIIALSYLPHLKGRRVGIVGRGGGIGVIATDTCELAGLKVPPFHPETRRKLEEIIPEAGAGARNPVESARGIAGTGDFYATGLKIVDADTEIDFILTHIAVDVYGAGLSGADMRKQVIEAAESLVKVFPSLTKPIVAVLYAGEQLEAISAVIEARQKLMQAGIAVYPTIDTAAKATVKLIGYYKFHEEENR
ncbi:MAG: CoA-binding protein [Chloroflexota bacterium]